MTSNSCVGNSESSSGNDNGCNDDFTAVRQLLLQSAWSSSEAVHAALHGMDQEIKRRQRDAKLKSKFAAATTLNTGMHTGSKTIATSAVALANGTTGAGRMEEDEEDDCEDDAVKVDYPVTGTGAIDSMAESAMSVSRNSHCGPPMNATEPNRLTTEHGGSNLDPKREIFAASTTGTSTTVAFATTSAASADTTGTTKASTMTDDWHTVTMEEDTIDDLNESASVADASITRLSSDWARRVIAKIASPSPSALNSSSSNSSSGTVECRSPTAAIAVAVHALLVDVLGCWVCTGIPDRTMTTALTAKTTTGQSAGLFAAPVRDLPPTQFLPLQWDKTMDLIQLRYRKQPVDTVGSRILTVSLHESSSVQVQVSFQPLVPLLNECAEESIWAFPLGDYINLESWNHAAQRALGSNNKSYDKAIPPALHYKSLAKLLATLVQKLQLGYDTTTTAVAADMDMTCAQSVGAASGDSISTSAPYVDYTMLQQIKDTTVSVRPVTKYPRLASHENANRDAFGNERFPDTSVFPPTGYPAGVDFPFRSGDFSGDLTPTGLFPFPHSGGGFVGMPGSGGGLLHPPGNLMGPNHPMFRGGGGGDGTSFIGGGALGMKPRFDPFGPPGGPTEPSPHTDGQGPRDPDGLFLMQQPDGPRRSQPPPGGTGNPNNDLQQPPSLGNNSRHFYL